MNYDCQNCTVEAIFDFGKSKVSRYSLLKGKACVKWSIRTWRCWIVSFSPSPSSLSYLSVIACKTLFSIFSSLGRWDGIPYSLWICLFSTRITILFPAASFSLKKGKAFMEQKICMIPRGRIDPGCRFPIILTNYWPGNTKTTCIIS